MKIASKKYKLPARKSLLTLALALIGVVYGPSPASAAPFVGLGTAQSFAVLGASTVTNTGSSTLWGNLGVDPGSAITGFPPGIVNGTIYGPGGMSNQAQSDALTAYNTLAGQPVTQDLTGVNLGGRTLTPGVYSSSDTTALLNGTLTLDFGTTPDAVFIFLIANALTTGTSSAVSVLSGGANSGIYWDIGSSATLGTSTAFAGNILAHTSITLVTSASIVCGRAIALNAAVTLDSNVISNDCSVGGGGTDYGSKGYSGTGSGGGTVPEPATLALLGLGLAGLGLGRRHRV